MGPLSLFPTQYTLRAHPALHSLLSIVMNQHQSVYRRQLITRLNSPNN